MTLTCGEDVVKLHPPQMKTLFPAQQKLADHFVTRLLAGGNTLDSSDLGTGKTVVACHVASTYLSFKPLTGARVAVICPKSAMGNWVRELEDADIDPLFVLNPEKLRTGGTPWVKKIGKKIMKWQLPPGSIVIVDEIHWAKSPFTLNAQLVISLTQHKYKLHLLSATAAEDPTQMRALGYALGVHGLTLSSPTLPDWYRWMKLNGCEPNVWNQWEFKDQSKLTQLHWSLYRAPDAPAGRLAVSDLPDAFKENRIIIEPVEFKGIDKVRKAYETLGITPEIVERLIEEGTVENSEWALVNILRARQLAESLKVPLFIEVVEELLEQGFSVPVFVNFEETIQALRAHFWCPVIHGGQSGAERQRGIDQFQADEARVLIINTAAGGAAISLHDVRGKHPRVSLISPSFSAIAFKQCTGRIFRNGAKSDAVQKVLVAKDSVEETVIRAILRKLKKLDLLHTGVTHP